MGIRRGIERSSCLDYSRGLKPRFLNYLCGCMDFPGPGDQKTRFPYYHRRLPRHPAVANKVGLKFPALGGEPKDFNCTFPWHGGHQTSQSKDEISQSGSGWHSDRGSTFPGIPWEFRSRSNISGRSARVYAQNFGADLDMIVIWAGDAIFAKFWQNAWNGINRRFEDVQILKKSNSKNGARPKLGARVPGPAQRANLGARVPARAHVDSLQFLEHEYKATLPFLDR